MFRMLSSFLLACAVIAAVAGCGPGADANGGDGNGAQRAEAGSELGSSSARRDRSGRKSLAGLRSPLFRGDFRSGNLAQFANVQCRPGRLTVASGRWARFEVREGDVEPQTGHEGRCEVIPGTEVDDGGEIWQRFAVRFGPRFSTRTWLVFNQWHANGGGGQPPLSFNVLPRSNVMVLRHGGGRPRYWRGPAIRPGWWYDFVVHIRFADDPRVGFVELWLDGRRQRMAGGGRRAFGPTSDPCVSGGCPASDASSSVYAKFGLYRSGSDIGTVVLHGDNFLIGRTAAGVALRD